MQSGHMLLRMFWLITALLAQRREHRSLASHPNWGEEAVLIARKESVEGKGM